MVGGRVSELGLLRWQAVPWSKGWFSIIYHPKRIVSVAELSEFYDVANLKKILIQQDKIYVHTKGQSRDVECC